MKSQYEARPCHWVFSINYQSFTAVKIEFLPIVTGPLTGRSSILIRVEQKNLSESQKYCQWHKLDKWHISGSSQGGLSELINVNGQRAGGVTFRILAGCFFLPITDVPH
jgi:hypothetical protein